MHTHRTCVACIHAVPYTQQSVLQTVQSWPALVQCQVSVYTELPALAYTRPAGMSRLVSFGPGLGVRVCTSGANTQASLLGLHIAFMNVLL